MTQENETITDKKDNNTFIQYSLRKYCEKTSGKVPEIEGNPNSKTLDMSTLKSIIKKYENHSSIINMNNKVANQKADTIFL